MERFPKPDGLSSRSVVEEAIELAKADREVSWTVLRKRAAVRTIPWEATPLEEAGTGDDDEEERRAASTGA